MARCTSLSAVLVMVGGSWIAAPSRGGPPEWAAGVLDASGRRAGLACVTGPDADRLAVELAKRSDLLVVALCPDRASVDRARRAHASTGLLGRRLYLAVGDADAIPLADHSVDLLVAPGDALGGDPGTTAAWRKLSPSRGTLVRLGPDGRPGKPLRKPRLDGADPWSHRYHDAANTAVSRDVALRWPYLTQWLGKPYNLTSRGCTELVADGRIIIAAREPFAWQAGDDRNDIFCAYSAHNGRRLWRRGMPERYMSGYSTMVARDDRIYMALGPRVLVLDAETGRTIESQTIEFECLEGHGRYLAISGDVLVFMAGPADWSDELPERPGLFSQKHLNEQSKGLSARGDRFVAYDLAAGRQLWRHREKAPVDAKMIAVADGRLYLHAEGHRVAAIDLRDGQMLWEQRDPAVLEANREARKIMDGIVRGLERGVTATPQAVVIGVRHSKALVALSPTDGSVLWKKTTDRRKGEFRSMGRVLQWVPIGGELWSRGAVYDLATGEALREVRVTTEGCGVLSATPLRIFGTCGAAYDLEANASLPTQAGLHKTPCDVGTFVGEGVMFSPPGPCTCATVTRGLKGAMSAGDFDYHQPADPADRLTRGDARPAQPLPVKVTAADWPAHRAGNGRAAASPVAVTLKPRLRTLWQPAAPFTTDYDARRYGPEHKPTPPIAVGDRVYFATTEGRVVCVDCATGEEGWTAWTEGAVMAAPTFAGGRVYVGSADGGVYCFDAATGGLRWRFRAAPVDRRIMVYGYLMSTWPVLGGVLVHDGVAYAAAGYAPGDGMHVYALDAATGRLRWQQNDLGHRPDEPDLGRTPVGRMCIAGGRLWLICANTAYTAFDLQSGELLPLVDEVSGSRKRQGGLGSEVAAYGDRYVLRGGQRLLADHYERVGSAFKIGRWVWYDFMRLDDAGVPDYPTICPLPEGLLPPAWDDGVTVVARSYRQRLEGWSTPKTLAFLESQHAENADRKFAFYRFSRVEAGKVSRQATPELPMRLWGPLELDVSGAVVASNAVVVAHRVAPPRRGDEPVKWLLSALDRQSGETRWEIELPAEPLLDGLSINRHGNVLVPLLDGRLLACEAAK